MTATQKELLDRFVNEANFVVDDAHVRPSRTDDKIYQVLYIGRGNTRKNSLHGATTVIVADLNGQLAGAVERCLNCPHWYQQAPAEKISEGTLYNSAEAALKALGLDVAL